MTTADSVAHALAHAFDFWLGEWDVHDADGDHVGRNSITDLYGTGALAEHWRGDRGVVGHSLSAWDAERGCWHQTWMDSTGGVLLLDGDVQRRRDGARGHRRRRAAADHLDPRRRRASASSGRRSKDDGETWETAFDGRYRRA